MVRRFYCWVKEPTPGLSGIGGRGTGDNCSACGCAVACGGGSICRGMEGAAACGEVGAAAASGGGGGGLRAGAAAGRGRGADILGRGFCSEALASEAFTSDALISEALASEALARSREICCWLALSCSMLALSCPISCPTLARSRAIDCSNCADSAETAAALGAMPCAAA